MHRVQYHQSTREHQWPRRYDLHSARVYYAQLLVNRFLPLRPVHRRDGCGVSPPLVIRPASRVRRPPNALRRRRSSASSVIGLDERTNNERLLSTAIETGRRCHASPPAAAAAVARSVRWERRTVTDHLASWWCIRSAVAADKWPSFCSLILS